MYRGWVEALNWAEPLRVLILFTLFAGLAHLLRMSLDCCHFHTDFICFVIFHLKGHRNFFLVTSETIRRLYFCWRAVCCVCCVFIHIIFIFVICYICIYVICYVIFAISIYTKVLVC